MSWIAHALIPIAVAGVFALLARLIPFEPPPDIPWEQRAAVANRYRWVDPAFLPVFFLSMGLLTWFWGWLLHAIAEWRLTLLPPSDFLIIPEPYWVFWLIPGLLLGILSSAVPMTLAIRGVLGKERYADYLLASQLRAGFDFRKATTLLFAGVGLLVAVWLVLSLDWYTRFGTDEIAINRLFGIGEKVYSYRDVTHLIEATHFQAPNGNIVERTRWFVVFQDGEQWCNEDMGSREGAVASQQDKSLRMFLEAKTGKSWQRVQFIEDAMGK